MVRIRATVGQENRATRRKERDFGFTLPVLAGMM